MVSFSNENPDFVDNSNSEHLMRVKNGITLLLNQVQCTKEQVSVLISLYRAKDRRRLKIVYNLFSFVCVFVKLKIVFSCLYVLLFYMTIKFIIIMIIIYYHYYYYKHTDVATFRQLEYILFTL